MTTFKPTFLYIKQHSKTGLLYFGKTTKSNPNSYFGSGKYWKRHLDKHGKEYVETLWYCLYTDLETLKNAADQFSLIFDVALSESWANLKPETGEDGGSTVGYSGFKGKKHTPEHIEKLRALGRTRPATEKMRQNMSKLGKAPRTESQIAASVRNGKNRAKPKEIRNHTCPICSNHFSQEEFAHHPFNTNKCCSKKCAGKLNPNNQFTVRENN